MKYFGYRTLAQDYLKCADLLFEAKSTGELDLSFDSPALAMLAHAAELAIKGNLLRLGYNEGDAERFGHNLSAAYIELGNAAPALRKEVSHEVREHWKRLLRNQRDEFAARFTGYGLNNPEALREAGVSSNDDIGRLLPGFERDLEWLSVRHKARGGEFRYYLSGIDVRPAIRAFGQEIFTIPISISVGARVLCGVIDAETAQS